MLIQYFVKNSIILEYNLASYTCIYLPIYASVNLSTSSYTYISLSTSLYKYKLSIFTSLFSFLSIPLPPPYLATSIPLYSSLFLSHHLTLLPLYLSTSQFLYHHLTLLPLYLSIDLWVTQLPLKPSTTTLFCYLSISSLPPGIPLYILLRLPISLPLNFSFTRFSSL